MKKSIKKILGFPQQTTLKSQLDNQLLQKIFLKFKTDIMTFKN